MEDDKNINRFLKKCLEDAGFAVDASLDGEEGAFLACTNNYDLIILDNVLPKKDGRQICQEIRSDGKDAPVLILSAKSEVGDKVDLLNMGADDYLNKPFHFEELLARIKALLRRPHVLKSDILQVDDLILDKNKKNVHRGGVEILLSPKEFMLLEYLMENEGAVVSRATISEHVWDKDFDVFSKTVEAHISNLRRKIDGQSEKKLIQTLSGRGYKIDS